MAREPQPRTSGFSVQEADERGLVRNGLIDSSANWDSQGKQKLRKGYLQTLQAAEDYVQNGPIGQNVQTLMDFYEIFLANRSKFLEENTFIQSDGVVGGLQLVLQDLGKTVWWHITGSIIFDTLDVGAMTLSLSLPSVESIWNYTLINRANGSATYGSSAGSPSEGPTATFAAGGNDREFQFNWFVKLDSYSIIDVNMAFDNKGGAEIKAGSWVRGLLTPSAYTSI